MFQENSIGTSILSRVKQITSPGWMHETSAQVWCTGKTQRDGMEREVGGGIGMGNTCKPMAVSFQCMTKPTTKKKKKKKNLKESLLLSCTAGRQLPKKLLQSARAGRVFQDLGMEILGDQTAELLRVDTRAAI